MKFISPPVIRKTLTQWAIFFPLGFVYGTHISSVLPYLKRIKRLLVFLTVVFFILDALQWRFSPYLSLCGYLSSVAAVLLLTMIERESIPCLNLLESIGKRSYGLYLSNLIVLDLTLLALSRIQPGLLEYRIAFIPLLYIIAIQVPMLVMKGLARTPGRVIYRYLFG
jgi:peptidoglycan/LPS O-acetylase OafA/YrhL